MSTMHVSLDAAGDSRKDFVNTVHERRDSTCMIWSYTGYTVMRTNIAL